MGYFIPRRVSIERMSFSSKAQHPQRCSQGKLEVGEIVSKFLFVICPFVTGPQVEKLETFTNEPFFQQFGSFETWSRCTNTGEQRRENKMFVHDIDYATRETQANRFRDDMGRSAME